MYASVVQKTEQFIDTHRCYRTRTRGSRDDTPRGGFKRARSVFVRRLFALLKISPNDSPKLRETLDHVTVRFCGPEASMDKYLKYCGDAETRELTGKGNTIFNDDDADDDNNINVQDYYGVREAREGKKRLRCMRSKRKSFATRRKIFCEAYRSRATICKAQRDLLVRKKRPSLQVSSIISSMNACAVPTVSMFASLASDVGRELLVELRARDEIIWDAKRADGMYEEEKDDEDDEDATCTMKTKTSTTRFWKKILSCLLTLKRDHHSPRRMTRLQFS